jgi:negative regulator of sigma E activity
MTEEDFNKPLPKPRASPALPEAPEGDTNPGYPVDVEYVRRKVNLARAAVHEEFAEKTKKDWFRNFVMAVGAVAATVVAVLVFVDNRVSAQTDAGMKVEAAERVALEKRVGTLEQQTLQSRDEQFQYRKDTHDDLKALQEVILTGQRSNRLDKPVSPPDAGR